MTKTLLAWNDPSGQAQMSAAGFALLSGVPGVEVEAVWNPSLNRPLSMPPEWVQATKTRQAKARAATGSDSLGPTLAWLAVTHLGCTVEVDAAGQLWLIEKDVR